ncbi:sulfotransferase domain-containing protein [Thermoleptolyngbya sp.]
MNIFHCCIYKTASQWLKSIFSDSRIVEFSNLIPYDYEREAFSRIGPQSLHKKVFPEPLKDGTFITPLYISYPAFQEIEKGSSYRAFFVTRDPRDVVISWYFSMKYSHVVIADYIDRDRKLFQSIPEKEGIKEAIRRVSRAGFFKALDSWIDAPLRDENVIVVKYEDLIKEDNLEIFTRLMKHCEIRVPEDVLSQVLKDNTFEKLTGRKRGFQDDQSHLRKGIEGDWINFFNDELLEEFHKIAGDLPERLGYKSRTELLEQHVSLYYKLAAQGSFELKKVTDELQNTRNELQQAHGELRQVGGELQQVSTELQLKSGQLIEATQRLEQAYVDLELLQATLDKKDIKLKRVRKRLSECKNCLKSTNAKLQKSQAMIEFMEKSRFWKLKNLWTSLKRFGSVHY